MKARTTRRSVLAAMLLVPAAGYWVLRLAGAPYGSAARRALLRGIDKVGLGGSGIERLLAPGPRFPQFVMDGRLRADHPRILWARAHSWTELRALVRERMRRQAADPVPGYACPGPSLAGQAVCALVGRDERQLALAIEQLLAYGPEPSDLSGRPGTLWELALAYDLLAASPALNTDQRAAIETRIAGHLSGLLELLDSDGPSLWHSRASFSAQAWLAASVLSPSSPTTRELIRQAQAHFLNAIEALSLTEAWPEGYNYWVTTRAFYLTLASAAYLNALDGAAFAKNVRTAIQRAGLWTLYATRPDGQIEGLGDEGPRVDLREETRPVIDLIAQLTRDPVMATFSAYIGRLRGASSYYRDYRWMYPLFHDPSVRPLAGVDPRTLSGLEAYLPPAEIFGRGAMNQVYLRNGWGPGSTFISFRAGASFTQHGHYDAGHFSLFKGAPLALRSGTYGGFFSAHRLNYYLRTVSTNSLLVLRPGERVHPNRFFRDNVADGGQRLVMPTGSSVLSVDDWRSNLDGGRHFEGGSVRTFRHTGALTYVDADLTGAYNSSRYSENADGGKVSRVRRELLYLHDEDRLILRDELSATHPEYTKKWLLHAAARPEIDGAQLLKGTPDNGILQAPRGPVRIRNGAGSLRVDPLLPEDGLVRLLGGPDYRFYVETDGDDSDLDGANQSQGANIRPWFDAGLWRIELQPGAPRTRDRFLVVLTPDLAGTERGPPRRLALPDPMVDGIALERSLVLFVDDRRGLPLAVQVPDGQRRLILVGLAPLSDVLLEAGTWAATPLRADDGGLLVWDRGAPLPARFTLTAAGGG